MKLLNVNIAIDTGIGGGTGERTFQMSRFLGKAGIDCAILTLDLGITAERLSALGGVAVTLLPCIWQRYYVFPLPEPRIAKLVEWADVVHLMGHWTLLNAAVYREARRLEKPYVVCPAGALPIYGRSTVLKHFYNRLIGTRIVRHASAHVAITEKERAHFHAYGVIDNRMFTIPNGIDAEEFSAGDAEAFRRDFGLPDKPLILFVGRLAEIKGPDLLLRAFVELRSELKDFQLVFVGPDGGQLQNLKAIAAGARLMDRIHFLGHVSQKSKVDAYATARLLVIPSRREAMSIVVLEAGICETPVLITDQCGFDQIERIGGGKIVTATVEGLKGGLVSLLARPRPLPDMGKKLAAFTRQHFLWESIAGRYQQLFELLLSRG